MIKSNSPANPYDEMHYEEISSFLSKESDIPIIDVRSPKEFEQGHIPGAHNIPIFSDEERAVVGTTYKKTGRIPAIEVGLDFVGPKMRSLAKEGTKLAKDNKLKVHCWRGGMRSEKMAWLFELLGNQVYVLEGGYKAYRRKLMEDFGSLSKLIVLQGPTGCGKTELLHALSNIGEQVLDLERRANHKGSAFGALGKSNQSSTEHFQNMLYDDLLKLDPKQRIWIESESLSIGKVYLPQPLWEAMNKSNVIQVDLDKQERIHRIVAEYGSFDKKLLTESIEKIKSRFGGNRVKEAIDLLERDKIGETVDLLLEYYDKSYGFSKNKYKRQPVGKFVVQSKDPLQNAKELVKMANELDL